MNEEIFKKIADYIWPKAVFCISSATGASGGIVTMWNDAKI